MPETLAILIIALRFLASPGAGILASRLFPQLRDRARLAYEAAPASPLARALAFLFLAPRYSRITALVLAQLIALAFAVPLALAEGNAVLPVVDALVAALFSQIYHAFTDLSPLPASPLRATYTGPFVCAECGHRFEGSSELSEDGEVLITFCPWCGELAGELPKPADAMEQASDEGEKAHD